METRINTAHVLADQGAPERIANKTHLMLQLNEEEKLFLSAIRSKEYRDQILDLLYK